MNGFIGEFLIILGSFAWKWPYAAVAASGVILSAVYMLWMVQRVYYGPVTNQKNQSLPDLELREWAAVLPLVAAAIVMGVLPTLFLKPTEPAVAKIVQRLAQGASFDARRAKPVIDVTAVPHEALVLPAAAGPRAIVPRPRG